MLGTSPAMDVAEVDVAVTVFGATLQGVEAVPIAVEVDLLRRLPAVCIVGLAASVVKESAERIRSAIGSAGLEFPRRRVVVNLAPADVRKDGALFDLPIALGLLAADGQVPVSALDQVVAVGELTLGGELRSIRGAMSLATLARNEGKTLLLPLECAAQAALVPGAQAIGVKTLAEAVAWLKGETQVQPAQPQALLRGGPTLDLADVRGQPMARQALEIAAAGAHHLLLVGPPGCGKSMLARRLPSILPGLTEEEAIEVSRIHNAAGLLSPEAGVVRERPFRAPHHTVSAAGMIGDRTLRPGEVSLAHHGVLFLDEAPEFPRHVLELLRQPLEDGQFSLSRAQGSITWPARITLVLAANPCPCGYRGTNRPCQCPDSEVLRYNRRLSGPILDRVDLHVDVQAVPPALLLQAPAGESSDEVRARVMAARREQSARGQRVPNGQLPAEDLRSVIQLDAAAADLLHQGAERFELSGRALARTQKVARTLADLAGRTLVGAEHIAAAFAFRGCSAGF